MARTPQLQFLQRIAADHSAAERLQLPVDDYRGLRDDARGDDGPSRRELFTRAAVLGLGAAVVGMPSIAPTRALAAPTATGATPRIAIIGAGISGLVAALTLADKGVKSTIYEANTSRVGGRMYSQGSPAHRGYWDNNQVSEYGGELIDTGHTMMRNLAKRFGFGLTQVRRQHGTQDDQILWIDGRYYPRTQADTDFKTVWDALAKDTAGVNGSSPSWNNHNAANVVLDNMSTRDWINSRVPGGASGELGAFLDVAYNVEYGSDTTSQSSYCLIGLLSSQTDPTHFNIWGTSDERFHVTGGNDQIPHAIAEHLADGTIQLGHTLTAVARNSDGSQTLTFDVNGAGTKTVTADHTILAVPLPILQHHVDLSKAGLDQMMQGVLSNMTMGYCTKLNMQCTERPWVGSGPWPGTSTGEAFTDLKMQQVWDATKGQPGDGGILIQYGGGSLAKALAPPSAFTKSDVDYTQDLATKVLAQVDQFYPGTSKVWNGKATLSAWHLNPYSYGAYSYWPVGYLTKFAGYETTAQGQLHFAGEHTSFNSQGYMEGGAEEGARAAKEVIKAVGL